MEESKNRNKNIIKEHMRSNSLITESQESKSIHAAKKLVMQRVGYDADRADEFIRVDLRDGLPVLKTPQGGKFILGVTRMFCDDELNDAATVSSLNATLRLVSSDKHINVFDRNLNGISCNELIKMFSNEMSEILDADKKEVNGMEFKNISDYNIVRIDSFDEAAEYSEYTSWCVAGREDAFDDYTNNGYKQFYFCLKHGFESVQKEIGEGCPLDEYGLSMLAVLVNENGSLASCTCRWNHENGGDDNVMDAKQISEIVGVNFYETFKPNNKWEDALSYVKYLLVVDGADPKDVFDECRDFEEGFACVRLSDKWNFLTTDKKFLSDIWFDDCNDFEDGLASVELNNKWNFITVDGKFMSNTWFSYCGYFEEGLAVVRLNGKWNFMDTDGKFLSDTWFDYCKSFRDGLASVQLDDKSNFISTEGQFLSDTWFDYCSNFYDGFSKVELNCKWNFLTTEGKILSDTWFNRCVYFEEDFACVELNGKWNFITTDGKILSNTWFDNVDDFQDGFADVKLNDKWYKIDRNGAIKDYSMGEGKTTNKNVILTERQFDIFRGIILEGGDSRLKPVKNIIKAAFEDTSLNPDAYVTSVEYQVPNRGEKTTWMHYLIYSLRHYFDLMGNSDVPMLKNVAKIAFLELDFEKENQDLERLNILKKIISLIKNDDNAKVEFIQSDNITFSTLYEQYADTMKQMGDEQRNAVNSKTYERNSRYEIIPIDDFKTAHEFGKYTGIDGEECLCYTTSRDIWGKFTKNGSNQCYLCYLPNYKEIPAQKGEGYPKDEYGLSMIWLFVDGQGNMSNSNVRWNHGDRSYSNVDTIFTESEISDIVGANFYETFKPNGKWQRMMSDALEKLANGVNPYDVFDHCKYSENGFMIVSMGNKQNFLTPDGKLLSDTWFDFCYDFEDGFARVALKDKYNFLTTDGKLLSDTWFDGCYDFANGFACVELNDKWNFLTADGNILSGTWFDTCGDFDEGLALVWLNRKANYLTTDGKYLSDTWFTRCLPFIDGLAFVKLKNKWNILTTDGKFLSNTWFDMCMPFINGVAHVKINGEWHKIDRNGVFINEGKTTNKNVILTEEQFDIFRELILEGGDSRLKPIKNIIRTAFEGTALNPDDYVTSAEYQVPNKGEQTTWMHYLIYSLRHFFGLMGNSDVPMLRNVAKIAFLELNFEKENQDLPKLNVFKKIINLIKNDDNAKAEFIQSNGVAFNALYGRYADVLKQMDDEQKNAVNSKSYERNSRYKIIPIDDFETAHEFGKYTGIDGEGRLCYTEGRQTWDNFTRGGSGQCYLCYMPNYKEIYPRKGENYPKDEYGLSMIWLFVDENGRLSNSNVRWNHGDGNYGNVDTIFTESEISDIVGVNFYEAFKPNGVWEEMLSDAMGRLAYGTNPKIVFDECGDFEEGLARIRLNAKWNYLTIDGKILSDIWFDDCNDFEEGLAVVRLNGKWNFITTDGKFLSNTWFNYCGYFDEGLAVVRLNGKWNFLTIDGKFLSDTWFDYCKSFRNGLASVQLDDKSNFISAKGEILSDTWFDYCSNFYDGFSKVELNRKWNFLTTGGKILSDTWFNRCGYFEEGFAYIKLNDKWNFLTIDGKFLSDTWFDHCYDFDNGFAIVELNGKRYTIDRNGVIKEEPLEEGKSTNKNVILTEEQFDIFRGLILEGGDSRLKPIKNIIRTAFEGTALNPDDYVTSAEYQVPNRGKQTTWMHYLIHSLRHFFGLMDNGDVPMLKNVAKIAFLDLDFKKGNQDTEKLNILKKIINLIKNDDNTKAKFIQSDDVTFNSLYEQYSGMLQQMDDEERNAVNSKTYERNSRYEIIPIDDFETAHELGKYTGDNGQGCLCYTERVPTWNSFTNNGNNQCYLCYMPNYKEIPPQKGEGYPKDEYGLSMIWLFVDEKGNISNSNVRWNHGDRSYSNVDNIFTESEISDIVGVNFYETFKPNNIWEEKLSKAMRELANGEDPYDVFDECGDFKNGFAVVWLNHKYNFITIDGKILSDTWFDDCYSFENGFACVKLNGKWNILATDGKFLSDTWFDICSNFENGLARIKLNGKMNFFTTEGKILSDTWFDECDDFKEGFARVALNSKWNFIATDGQILSDTWFDRCGYFENGYATVILKGMHNFLTNDGNILSDTWFDNCHRFINGFAYVELDDKCNFITTDGKILSNVWFDNCYQFKNGFAEVRLNGKWYNLDANGTINERSIGESEPKWRLR